MNEILQQIALFAIPAIVAITLHEAAHGYAALHFGDDTAKRMGRVTLNPLNHVDIFGTIILPALLVLSHAGFVFGYARPVPVNFSALRHPKTDGIWVAAAGPAMNVIVAAVSALLLFVALRLELTASADIGNMLLLSIKLNFVLALFNLLPLPPLDGSRILAGVLPDVLAKPYLRLDRYGMTLLLIIFIVLPWLGEYHGHSLDIFEPLVQRPAEALTHAFLRLVGF